MSIKEKPKKEKESEDIDIWLNSQLESRVKPKETTSVNEITVEESKKKTLITDVQEEKTETAPVNEEKVIDLHPKFVLQLPSWTSKPWMYVTPMQENQLSSWLDSWKTVVIDYAKILRYHILSLTDLRKVHPFKNYATNRALTKDQVDLIAKTMVEGGLAKWLDENFILIRVYYKTDLEWSEIILDYLMETGLASEVLTLFELEKQNQEWSSLPREELKLVLQLLVDQGRASWVGEDRDTLSFVL